MTEKTADEPARTFFLSGIAGECHAIYFPPRKAVARKKSFIFIPPFAEEMNKSRRMLDLQARRFSLLGYGVLMLDLYGTGDSRGDFRESRWEIWKDDLNSAFTWLKSQGAEIISLLGLRLGALLAMDIATLKHDELEKIVLWQPVLSGEAMITQFLRLRLAADMMSGRQEKETTQSLRQALASGTSIEVGGYELAPELIAAIDRKRLKDMGSERTPAVHWFEIVARQRRSFATASNSVIDEWRNRGINVTATAVVDAPFWMSTEITTAPNLLQETTRIIE